MEKLLPLRTMKVNRVIGLLLLVLLISLSINYAQVPDSQLLKQPPQVELGGTQLLKINSSITGQEYVFYISLPQHYSDTSKTFPVIYVLDGQWDFALMNAIYGDQYYDGFVPRAITVGITWGGANPDYDKRRSFDLTPTDAGQPSQFGNGEKFLSFIKKEAIPFIESKYRTKNNERTLIGSSFGGLFTLYALFRESELFNRYVLTSPAWAWDNGSLNKFAEKFSKTNLSHPVTIYMSVGEYEDVPGFERLAADLKGYQMKGLELEAKVIQGSGHAGTKPEGYNRGLQYVFTRKTINVNPAVLNQYVGTYEINPQLKIKLVKENDRLVAIGPDNTKITAYAETEEDFFIKGQYLFIHFEKDKTGKVDGFQLHQFAGDVFVKRIE
jgi:predicted alpha/beta superfamily hydrolase